MTGDEQRIEDILHRVRSGDRAAFDELQRETESRVFHFAARLVGLSAGVFDVVQRAFLSLWINRDRVERQESVIPYLFRIVRNLCYDELRRRGRFDHVSIENEDEGDWYGTRLVYGAAASDRPDNESERRDLWLKVAAAIDSLPERQRQALILYAEEGLSYQQVAETLGIGTNTVKSRIQQARKNLRSRLGPEVLRNIGIKEN